MGDLEKNFNQAAEDVKKLSKEPTNEEMLEIYGLYKQVVVGDCNTAKPGMFDLKGKAKWEAWNSLQGKGKEDAQAEYVIKVGELQEKYN